MDPIISECSCSPFPSLFMLHTRRVITSSASCVIRRPLLRKNLPPLWHVFVTATKICISSMLISQLKAGLAGPVMVSMQPTTRIISRMRFLLEAGSCRSILKRQKPAASVGRAATINPSMIATNQWKTYKNNNDIWKMYTDILIYLKPFEAGSEMALLFLLNDFQCLLSINGCESFLQVQGVRWTPWVRFCIAKL